MFQFWGKILVFWARSLIPVLNIYFTPIYCKNKRNWKNSMFFFYIFGQKNKKLSFRIRAWFLKKASSRKILKLFALTLGINRHQVYQLIPKLSEGYVNPKRQKIFSKFKKKTSQNLAFLDFLGHLVMLGPNASSNLPKILYASPYM